MSYSNPTTISYNFGNFDFGGAGDAWSIKGPSGMKGRIIDCIVSATEVFTTGGKIELGITAGSAEYLDLDLGTLADTNTLTASETSGAIVLALLPKDTQIEGTFTITTGSPTGQAWVTLVIDWF